MSLDMLMLKLRAEIDELKSQVTDREEQLSSLFKKISEVVSYFEKETEEMIGTLRKTCIEQVRLNWIIID